MQRTNLAQLVELSLQALEALLVNPADLAWARRMGADFVNSARQLRRHHAQIIDTQGVPRPIDQRYRSPDYIIASTERAS